MDVKELEEILNEKEGFGGDNDMQQNEFVIHDANLANWAIEKIKEKRAAFNLYEDVASNKINELKLGVLEERKRLENSTSFLTTKLAEFLINNPDLPIKATKTQETLKLPSGSVVKKLSVNKIATIDTEKQADSDMLKTYCEEIMPEYIKSKTTVDWVEFKKILKVEDKKVYNTKTGEEMECFRVDETLPEVIVK